MVTANSDISAAILTSDSDAELDKPSEVNATAVEPTSEKSEPAEAQSKSLDMPPIVAPVPIRARTGRSNSSPNSPLPPSLEIQAQSKSNMPTSTFYPLRTPPTPPPFSNFLILPEPTESSASIKPGTLVEPIGRIEPLSDDFRARRRRVAKLSKFFGVEVNTLVDHLPNETSPPFVSRSGPVRLPQSPPPVHAADSIHRHALTPPSVTVAQARGRYIAQDDVEELDMSEVIERLRKIKS